MGNNCLSASALRAAVIGVGYLGAFHADKYMAVKGVELVAVADTDMKRAQLAGTRLGVPWYSDYRALLGKVDLVSIVVPTEAHYGVARECLEAGVHILLEKPVTRTLEEADELIRLARQRGLVFQAGHLERFNPAMQVIKGRLHRPLFIESHRLAPFNPRGTDVNVVLDLMIHDIDIILSVAGSPVTDLRASGACVLTDQIDIANVRLEFASGCAANVTASRVSQHMMRKMRVFQHNAYFSIDFLKRAVSICHKASGIPKENAPLMVEDLQLETGDALMCEIENFVSAVKHGNAPEVPGEEGRRALEIALEISRCLRETLPP